MKLIFLSSKFYSQYANCPEILTKPARPYACVQVRINNLLFAVPFRHHITHNYAFFTIGNAGLDYTKAVVISSRDQISKSSPQIDQKEFNALKGKDAVIKSGLEKYIRVYKRAAQYIGNPRYDTIRACSSLQYFGEYL